MGVQTPILTFGVWMSTRWAPTNYKWSYKPYKWPYKWVTGVITLLIGVITPLITGRGPPCRVMVSRKLVVSTHSTCCSQIFGSCPQGKHLDETTSHYYSQCNTTLDLLKVVGNNIKNYSPWFRIRKKITQKNKSKMFEPAW